MFTQQCIESEWLGGDNMESVDQVKFVLDLPISKVSKYYLGEYEDLKEFNLTENEVKKLAMYGHLSKQIDRKKVNIELHIVDEITTTTFSDYIEKIVERCLGRYEYVVEFTINGEDILTHYDELTLNECGKIIMDFATSNVIDEISITFPPNLENDEKKNFL